MTAVARVMTVGGVPGAALADPEGAAVAAALVEAGVPVASRVVLDEDEATLERALAPDDGLTVVLAGTWAAQQAERVLGVKDPGAIVIDEVAGMTLTVLAFPLTLPTLAAGLVLFRLFDVTKPFPARASQRARGGFGVMVDDLIAGVYAAIVLALLRAVTHWP